MLRLLAYTGAIGATLLIGPAFAQTNPDPNAQGATTSAPAQPAQEAPKVDQRATANASAFVARQSIDQWRAPKLIGVIVYDASDQRVGKIEDMLVNHDGKVDTVVIGVGGFLGIGAKDVAVPFKALSWRTEPRRVPSTNPPPSGSIGTTGEASVVNYRTIDPAQTEARQGYPDKAHIDLTREQLQTAPDFEYAQGPLADAD
jgi:sporulation protein YlmC with PRC-barrel domain